MTEDAQIEPPADDDQAPTFGEPCKELIAALIKAQSEMKPAALNKINPHFQSKYADLASIREATVGPLNDNGLAICQGTRMNGGDIVLWTRLLHTSGQLIESEYPIPLDAPQKMGISITYARRYCWSAMCGMVADEDQDAETTVTRRRAGELHGPLNITKLKKEVGILVNAVAACQELGDLDDLLATNKAVFEQLERDLPNWWYTKQGSDVKGMVERLEEKRKELAPDADFLPRTGAVSTSKIFALIDQFGEEVYQTENVDDYAERLSALLEKMPDLVQLKQLWDNNKEQVKSLPDSRAADVTALYEGKSVEFPDEPEELHPAAMP